MIKVLIVEDDPMVREINEKFLEKVEGYQLCGSASSIEQAKEIVLKEKPDLILLDVFFPQGRGVDFLKWIRKEGVKCDVILITADKSIETVEESFRYGAVDYLIKPFRFNRFKQALLQYRKRKYHFEKAGNAEQEIIDRFALNKKQEEEEEKDEEIEKIGEIKGFSAHTYEILFKCIREMGGELFTAQEIAEKAGVSRITARRYLDYMEKEGILSIELEYGKVGRPQNRYRLKKG